MTEVLYQAVPELDDPCWACGRETHGCYVVWGLASGEAVHVCDECVADDSREDWPDEGELDAEELHPSAEWNWKDGD